MFTGIIEALGEIDAVTAGGQSGRMAIRAPGDFGPLAIGESIAVTFRCKAHHKCFRTRSVITGCCRHKSALVFAVPTFGDFASH